MLEYKGREREREPEREPEREAWCCNPEISLGRQRERETDRQTDRQTEMVEMVEEKRKGKKKRRNAKGIHTNERNFWGKLTAVRERRVQGKRLSLEANSTAMKGVCLGLIRGKDGIERRMKDGCKCLIDRTNVHVKHLLAGATASVVAR